VDYGIRKGFTECHLDVDLASILVSKLQNEAHELIRKYRDGGDFTWERLSQLDEGNRMSISRQEGERLIVNHSL
jgi:hypothetical protein